MADDMKTLRENAAKKAMSPSQQIRDHYTEDRERVDAADSYLVRTKQRWESALKETGLDSAELKRIFSEGSPEEKKKYLALEPIWRDVVEAGKAWRDAYKGTQLDVVGDDEAINGFLGLGPPARGAFGKVVRPDYGEMPNHGLYAPMKYNHELSDIEKRRDEVARRLQRTARAAETQRAGGVGPTED
jgi:hypothetical protein